MEVVEFFVTTAGDRATRGYENQFNRRNGIGGWSGSRNVLRFHDGLWRGRCDRAACADTDAEGRLKLRTNAMARRRTAGCCFVQAIPGSRSSRWRKKKEPDFQEELAVANEIAVAWQPHTVAGAKRR